MWPREVYLASGKTTPNVVNTELLAVFRNYARNYINRSRIKRYLISCFSSLKLLVQCCLKTNNVNKLNSALLTVNKIIKDENYVIKFLHPNVWIESLTLVRTPMQGMKMRRSIYKNAMYAQLSSAVDSPLFLIFTLRINTRRTAIYRH